MWWTNSWDLCPPSNETDYRYTSNLQGNYQEKIRMSGVSPRCATRFRPFSKTTPKNNTL